MSRIRLLAGFCLLVLSNQAGLEVSAQIDRIEEVLVLPLASEGSDGTLARDLYEGIISGLRLQPRQRLIGPQRVDELVSNQPLSRILSSVEGIRSFASRSGAAFLIGGIVRYLEDGRIEVSTLIYSREDNQIRQLLHDVFSDEEEARSGASKIGERLSRLRNFSPSDTALLYSLLLPGVGQLQRDAPMHALISAGLVAGSVIYSLTTPKPDEFEIDFSDFRSELIPNTTDYLYYIRQKEVSEEEFFRILEEEIEHNTSAKRDRQAVARRKQRAVIMFAATYLFNLIDTWWLIRKDIDARPFFVRIQAVPETGNRTGQMSLGLQLRWTFR